MKIAVFGTGGVGGYYGARWAAAGEEVHFVARGAHLEAMKAAGLRVSSPNGDLHLEPVRATDDPATIGPVDLVVVAVKLYDTESVARGCAPLLGPETSVVSFQNGVTAVETLAAAVGAERVFGGTTYIMSVIEEPGVILHTGRRARLVFGELDGRSSPRVQALLEACERAGVDAVVTDDIRGLIWSKFTFLVALSGMTSLMRLPVGSIRSDPETRALFRAAVDEAVAVARAKGVPVRDDMADRHMATVDDLPASVGSSMLYDLTHGKRLELPWLSGTVSRMGAELGVPTPVHDVVAAALKPYAEGQPPTP